MLRDVLFEGNYLRGKVDICEIFMFGYENWDNILMVI